MRRLHSAIDSAAEFLARTQKRSGEIPVHRSDAPGLSTTHRDPSIFGTAVAAHALRHSTHPVVRQIVERANRYLARERRDDGTWSYWPKATECSSDADDTACCMLALQLPANAALRAKFEAHRAPSRLFCTWFHDGPNDVDSVVNANVLALLGPRRVTMEPVQYLVDLVLFDQEPGSSRYYPHTAALHYAIARAMERVPHLRLCEGVLVRKLRSCVSEAGGSLVAVAQSLAALALRGVAPLPEFAGALERLLDAQRPDGSWPAEAWYAGPEPGRPLSCWYGSVEWSTVLCLEPLLRTA
jgi:hypothetical protein